MVISLIINVILVLIGYFIGLKTALREYEKMINNNEALQDAFRRHIIKQAEEAERAKKEATGDAEAPPEAPEAEEATEIIDGRVFKSFNLYNNIEDASGSKKTLKKI